MNIGIIGMGMVGKAIYKGLSEKGHNMSFYDKNVDSKIENVLNTEINFICVPTLPNENNECDLSCLHDVLERLHYNDYNGIICIKSTIIPGTTDQCIKKYDNHKICFCPEFLKERCAYEDFVNNNPICIIGTLNLEVFKCISTIHKHICHKFKMVTPKEAELTKYMQNVFNTYRILFANAYYDICKENGVVYNSVLESLLERNELDDKYMKCSDELRGPSGPCLVKDTLAFDKYVSTLNIKCELFRTMVKDMQLYPKTVIDGTRTEKEYFGENINNLNIV